MGLRILPALLLVSVLFAGCTAADHLKSQKRLVEGARELALAEKRERDAVLAFYKAPKTTAYQRATESVERPTPQAARVALAADAKTDYETATALGSGLERLDRISYLYRAAIKAWHSGAAGEELALDIQEKGREHCESPKGALRPPRDCGMFEFVVYLIAAEAATDRLFDQMLGRMYAQAEAIAEGRTPATKYSDADLVVVSDVVADYRTALAGSATIGSTQQGLAYEPASMTRLLKPFVDRQLLIYWCYASDARNRIETNVGHNDLRLKRANVDFAAISKVLTSKRNIEIGEKPQDYDNLCQVVRNRAADARAHALDLDENDAALPTM